jgi:hypothetical protein
MLAPKNPFGWATLTGSCGSKPDIGARSIQAPFVDSNIRFLIGAAF